MTEKKLNFSDLSKTAVIKMLAEGHCRLIDVPKHHVKSPTDAVKAAEMSEGVFASFLCSAKCKTLYCWYEWSAEKWVDQSGYNVAAKHSLNCGVVAHTATNVKKYFESRQREISKTPLSLCSARQHKVVELITSPPTVTFLARCDIICEAANFAARSTHAANQVYDCSKSRQTVSGSILEQGRLA